MKRLLLVSTDEEYVTSVLGNLAYNISDEYSIEVITNIDLLSSILGTNNKIDVLLIEEKLLPYVANSNIFGRVFVITETDGIGANIISKYAGALGITKIMGQAYLKKSDDSRAGRTKIHDVVCVDNPDMKTVTALALSEQLAKFGRKVLYLCADNLQDFYSVKKFKESSLAMEEQALIINALLNGNSRELDRVIAKDSFDYIPQFEHFLSSYGMDSAAIFRVADEISKMELYDEIVIEHPFGFTLDSITRIENSESVILVTGRGERTLGKLKKLFDNTRGVAKNCVLVCYPSSEIDGCRELLGVTVCEHIDSTCKDMSLDAIVEGKMFRATAEAVL